MIRKFALALLSVLALVANPALAGNPVGAPISTSTGVLQPVGIYCDNGTGVAAICSFAGGGGGTSGGTATSAAPTYSNGATNQPLSLDLNGNLRVTGSFSATNASIAATAGAVPASATYVGMSVGGTMTGLTGTSNGLKVDGSAVTQPVSGTITANLGTLNGAATAANQTTINTTLTSISATLGSPFQAGGSIGNTSFGISGNLPAFAATPTFNLGTLNGAATAANQTAVQSSPGTSAGTAMTVQGSASGVPLPVANLGAGNWATSQVSVGATFTLIANARTTRQAAIVTNHGTTNVFCGPTSGVTATTGSIVPGVVGAARTIATTTAIYCITASGTQTVSVDEYY